MSVYTTITPDALSPWLARYNVGELVGLKGIAAGITNTNYFVTTTRGRFVLTVFEVLRLDELPFYLNLMHHLARHGVAVASPVADRNDAFASLLAGKPACLVHCLPGQDVSTPGAGQCTQVGQQMAADQEARTRLISAATDASSDVATAASQLSEAASGLSTSATEAVREAYRQSKTPRAFHELVAEADRKSVV